MVERVKNKKGFTIIEIMVVIALIGILAAVLVPRFTGVKNTAKNAGMLTNAKMVEAYVASEIDSWTAEDAVGTVVGTNDMIAAIVEHFTDNPLTNPYTNEEDDANVNVASGTNYSAGSGVGVVYVVVDADTAGEPLTVYINGFNADGNEIKTTQRTVTQ